MTSDTPKTPTTLRKAFNGELCSKKVRVALLAVGRFDVSTRSILMPTSSLGSLRTMLACETDQLFSLKHFFSIRVDLSGPRPTCEPFYSIVWRELELRTDLSLLTWGFLLPLQWLLTLMEGSTGHSHIVTVTNTQRMSHPHPHHRLGGQW